MSKKTESSRLNFLYIYHVLQINTDEEHPMGVQDITDEINRRYISRSQDGYCISADTVKRILEVVTQEIFPDSFYNDEKKHDYGFEIVAVVMQYGSYVAYDPEQHRNQKKYYYMEHDFSTSEVRTLIDAVETYSYFSEEEVTDLINKLIRLRPKSFGLRQFKDPSYLLREEDSIVLMNIDMLNEIIRRNHRASIEYCNYDINKKLVTRPGYPSEIEPLKLIWSNGYYYLIAYNPKYDDLTNFRLDRIREIEEIERVADHKLSDFETVRYRLEHPVMYAGETDQFVMLCRQTDKNNMIDLILDTFGRDSTIRYAEKKEIAEHIVDGNETDDRWIHARVKATPGGAELWATQYGRDVMIISPVSSADRVRENLEIALKRYP